MYKELKYVDCKLYVESFLQPVNKITVNFKAESE